MSQGLEVLLRTSHHPCLTGVWEDQMKQRMGSGNVKQQVLHRCPGKQSTRVEGRATLLHSGLEQRDLRDCPIQSSEGSSTMPRVGSRGQQGACLPGKQPGGWAEVMDRGDSTGEGGQHGVWDQPSLGEVCRWCLPSSPVEAQVTGAQPSAPRGLALPIGKTGHSSACPRPHPSHVPWPWCGGVVALRTGLWPFLYV